MASSREALAAVSVRREPGAESKLELLEELQRHQGDARYCAQRAVDWLVTHGLAPRVVVAALTPARTGFEGLAGAGVQPQLVQRLSIWLDGPRDPLVAAMMSGRPISFAETNAPARLVPVTTL